MLELEMGILVASALSLASDSNFDSNINNH